MQNFPENPRINMAGIARFFFIPAPYVLALPPVVGGLITSPLQIIGNGSFFTGYATRETLDFTEATSQDDNGTVYKQTITGSIPGNYPELASLMQEMEVYRHYVLLQDPNGFLRLAGYENPLVFLGGFKSGSKASDYKGYAFTFSTDCISRAPFYLVA